MTRAATVSFSDRAGPVVAGLLATLVYWLTRQDWLYGDGPYLLTVLARAREAGNLPVWRHALYLPLSDLLLDLSLVRTPDEACRLVSALSGGALVAATYALCRRSATRAAALGATLLMATSPAVWFFATTVEVHALHGAVVAAAALFLATAPRALRPAAIAAGPLLFFTAHESSWLLLPGWILLAATGSAARPGAPERRALLVSLGLTALGAALGLATSALVKTLGTGAGHLSSLALIEHMHTSSPSLRLLWSGVLWPHAGVLGLALVGLARAPRSLLLAFLVPHVLFVLCVFDDPNGGGYLLPIAWVCALGAARTLDGLPRTRWLVAPLLLVQLFAVHSVVWGPHQERSRAERARRVQAAELALPRGGLVLSADFSLQTIEGLAPGVHELNLWRELSGAEERGEPPAAFAERLGACLEDLRAAYPALAIDLSYRSELKPRPETLALMEALTGAARARYGGAEVAGQGDRLLVLAPSR